MEAMVYPFRFHTDEHLDAMNVNDTFRDLAKRYNKYCDARDRYVAFVTSDDQGPKYTCPTCRAPVSDGLVL